MAEIYKNTTLTVGHLINKIETGELGLPELQRPFVWKDTKVRDLFDSMMRGYPIGYLMLWECPDTDKNRTIGTGTHSYESPKEVIIDGQHRYICCLEQASLDMWMEMEEFNGATMDHVGLLNNTRKGWDSKDIRHAIMSKYPGKVSALEEIHKLSKQFDVTEKSAELLITRKKDQFRRSELNAYQQGHKPADMSKYHCDAAKKNVAWDIMYSILIASKGNEKQLRKLKKIEFMAAIMDILTTLDKRGEEEGMKQFEENISTFISLLTPDQIDDIVDLIDSKNFDVLNKMVNKAYFSFIKGNEADLASYRQMNQKAIEAMKAELDASPITRKVKVGSPAEVMKGYYLIIEEETTKSAPSSACDENPVTIADQQPEHETTLNT